MSPKYRFHAYLCPTNDMVGMLYQSFSFQLDLVRILLLIVNSFMPGMFSMCYLNVYLRLMCFFRTSFGPVSDCSLFTSDVLFSGNGSTACISKSWCGLWRFGHIPFVCFQKYISCRNRCPGRFTRSFIGHHIFPHSYRAREVCYYCL